MAYNRIPLILKHEVEITEFCNENENILKVIFIIILWTTFQVNEEDRG